jgi:excisionase family DNA binding protein
MRPGSPVPDRALLSISEAAAVAGLSTSVAYRLARQDRLPGLVRLPGRQLLVRRPVLEAWLTGREPRDDGGREGAPRPP